MSMTVVAVKSLMLQTLPIATMIVMGMLLFWHLPRYFKSPFKGVEGVSVATIRARRHRKPLPPKQLVAKVFVLLVVSRALIVLIAWGMAAATGHFRSVFFDPLNAWVRWDANHYLGLAENWYVNEGDPRFHIVFFPLYPLLVRMIGHLMMGNVVAAAVVVSNVCLLVAGCLLYRLVESAQGGGAADRALWYLMICPLSLFFSIPYSESLFLMITLASVWMARQRRMAWAVVFGISAALTRQLGLLCAVPVFWEFLCAAKERAQNAQCDRKVLTRQIAKGFFLTCLIALGLVLYLGLNYVVTGDPFKFLQYQREHWSQQFGSLHGSVKNTIVQIFETSDLAVNLGIWMPQLISIFAVLVLMCVTARRAHPGDAAYALLYVYCALSPTWLLSGPRYLSAMYALYPMLSLVTKKGWQHVAMTAMFFVTGVYIVYMYAVVGTVF